MVYIYLSIPISIEISVVFLLIFALDKQECCTYGKDEMIKI